MTTKTAEQRIHGSIEDHYVAAWRTYLENLDQTLDEVGECLDQARAVTEVCTDEWCEATDHLLDQLNHVLFSISEPRWTSDEDSRKLKALRKRVRDLYRDFEAMVAA